MQLQYVALVWKFIPRLSPYFLSFLKPNQILGLILATFFPDPQAGQDGRGGGSAGCIQQRRGKGRTNCDLIWPRDGSPKKAIG